MHDDATTSPEESKTPSCSCPGMRIARGVIGGLLLAVMLGNLVAFASPEWAATLGSYLPEGCAAGTSGGGCSSGGCCPGMTSIGMPESVLESHMTQDTAGETVPDSADTGE